MFALNLGRFMFQGRGREPLPLGPQAEASNIPFFKVNWEQGLSGEMRARRAPLQVLAVLGLMAALGWIVLDPALAARKYASSWGIVVLSVFFTADMVLGWSRRCTISLSREGVRIVQRQALFPDKVMNIPAREFLGVTVVPVGAVARRVWMIMLLHPQPEKNVPLAWSQRYKDIGSGLGSYALRLNVPILDFLERMEGRELRALHPMAGGLTLAGKLSLGLEQREPFTSPPPGLRADWEGNRTTIRLDFRRRLHIDRETVAFETFSLRGWRRTWQLPLDLIVSVYAIGDTPRVVLRTYDEIVETGSCRPEVARWVKGAIVRAAGMTTAAL